MFVKAMWAKEYQQAKSLLWGLFALSFFMLPFYTMQQLAGFQERIDEMQRMNMTPELGSMAFSLNNGFPLFLMLLLIALGCQLIGRERADGQNDLTFSLPYPRSTIYLTKWALGCSGLVVSVVVNLFWTYLLLNNSPVTPYLAFEPNWGVYGLHLVMAGMALYTLTLLMGAISGGYLFQFAFSLIFSIFPLGFTYLWLFFLDIHGVSIAGNLVDTIMINVMHIVSNLSLSTQMMSANSGGVLFMQPASHGSWLYSLAYLVVLLPLGAFLYARNKVEYNGRLLVFPGLQGFFLWGIVICFALLGGMISTGMMATSNLLFYYLGMLIFGSIAYWVTTRLMHRPHQRRVNSSGHSGYPIV